MEKKIVWQGQSQTQQFLIVSSNLTRKGITKIVLIGNSRKLQMWRIRLGPESDLQGHIETCQKSAAKEVISKTKVNGKIAYSVGQTMVIVQSSHVSYLLERFQLNMGFSECSAPLLLLLWAIQGKPLHPIESLLVQSLWHTHTHF